MQVIKNGIYLHYKQKLYNVLDIVTDHRTNKNLVLYNAMYDKKASWIRPYDMFIEQVCDDGKLVNRFTFINSITDKNNIYTNFSLCPNTSKYKIFSDSDKYTIYGYATHTESKKDYMIFSNKSEDKKYAIPVNETSKFLNLQISLTDKKYTRYYNELCELLKE